MVGKTTMRSREKGGKGQLRRGETKVRRSPCPPSFARPRTHAPPSCLPVPLSALTYVDRLSTQDAVAQAEERFGGAASAAGPAAAAAAAAGARRRRRRVLARGSAPVDAQRRGDLLEHRRELRRLGQVAPEALHADAEQRRHLCFWLAYSPLFGEGFAVAAADSCGQGQNAPRRERESGVSVSGHDAARCSISSPPSLMSCILLDRLHDPTLQIGPGSEVYEANFGTNDRLKKAAQFSSKRGVI